MHLGRLSCLFNSHAPDRRTVKWTGFNYGGKCRSCGKPIRRSKAATWRNASKEDLEYARHDG